MAFRDTVNRVLRRLRETTISDDWSGSYESSTAVTDYQKLICDLVNEVKREVEDSWDWTALRRSQQITTSSGTQAYALTGSNQRTRIINVVDHDGTNLSQVSYAWMKDAKYPSTSNGRPSYYSVGSVSSDVLSIDVWPIPDAAYDYDFNIVDPQDDLYLAADDISILENVVVLGAWARAIAERGEDGGALSDMAQNQYAQALADAVAIDAGRHSEELVWYA